MQDKIFDILLKEDDITWQSMIYDLVNSEEMDPWDVDISKLTNKFIEILKKLKEMDFRISGKVLLAAAILLKIKSKRLMEHDFVALDEMISRTDDPDEDVFFEELEHSLEPLDQRINEEPGLVPKTPQPRKRKVSVFDLVESLEKALEVKYRRKPFIPKERDVVVPKKKRDISLVIKDVYQNILQFFGKNKNQTLTFTQLLPSDEKEDKVFTFVPLLHLSNQRRVDLLQQQHFGEIEIELLKRAEKQ